MSMPRYYVTLGVVGTDIKTTMKIGAGIGDYERLKGYIGHWCKWETMAKYLEEDNGGIVGIARAWNENYSKMFATMGAEPLGGEHHWVPRDEGELAEYWKNVDKEKDGEKS